MIRFQPAPSRTVGPREPSVHEIVNRAVADLGVVCVGVDDGTIYFERIGESLKKNRDDIAQQILDRLVSIPQPTRAILEQTTDKIAIR